RGDVELSAGIQNLIDQQMQMYQFLSTLMMGPPMMVWGNVTRSRLKMRPNAIWPMGNAPTNKVEAYQVHNHAIDGFPNIYGLLKSQIMNVQSSTDNSVPASDGNPSFSKTQAGVQAALQRLGVSDNYLRKQFEEWFEAQSETSINIYFAEMRGKHSIHLDADDRGDIMRTPSRKYVDKNNVLTFDYSDINKVTFDFAVDPSSSEVKEDQDNAEKLTEVLALIQKSQNPQIQAAELPVTKLLINEIGAEGTDDIFPATTDEDGNPLPDSQGQAAGGLNPQTLVPMVTQIVQQIMQQQQANDISEHPLIKLMTALQIKFGDLPEDSKQELLKLVGIPSNMVSPGQQQINLKAQQQQTDTVLKADKQAHDTTLAVRQQAHNESQDRINAQQTAQSQAAEGQEPPVQPKPKQRLPAQPPQQAMGNHPPDPQEQQIVEALVHRGYNDQDIEQAIVMLRQGSTAEQVMATLGAKHANQQ